MLAGRAWVAVVAGMVAACPAPPSNGPSETAFPTEFTPPPKLGAPPPSDPRAFGHAYLEQVYDGIVEPWTQFLEDCRRRLPPSHPLNDPTLAATAELTIDPSGALVALAIDGSGKDDFDAAVGGVVRDRAPYPRPLPGLLSDDGRLHLRWRFARDVRQAGVAGAEVVVVEWGIERAVPKLLAEAASHAPPATAAPSSPKPCSPPRSPRASRAVTPRRAGSRSRSRRAPRSPPPRPVCARAPPAPSIPPCGPAP
jgi:hypothetical protein